MTENPQTPDLTITPMFIVGNKARCWNTIDTGRLFGGTPIIDLPLIRRSPLVGKWNPAIMRNKVVLPQPDGPRMEKNDPCGTSKLTRSTARNASKSFVRSLQTRSGWGTVKSGPRKVKKGTKGCPLCWLFVDLVRRVDPVECRTFQCFQSGRHRRIPFDVVNRGQIKAATIGGTQLFHHFLVVGCRDFDSVPRFGLKQVNHLLWRVTTPSQKPQRFRLRCLSCQSRNNGDR